MYVPNLLVIPASLHVSALSLADTTVLIRARTTATTARCPVCTTPAERLHGHYTRTLADVPWGDHAVRIEITVRKYYCDNPLCPRRVFAERLDGVAEAYARRTDRQRAALLEIAFALGGEAGARLAFELKLPISADSLLRYIRIAAEPEADAPRVLGVDDWAWRRGRRYGTILVDLETHRVVDLLEDRSAASVAEWLRNHPGVEVISRDRGGEYAEGAQQGAPDAVQVADRWHLLHNLSDLLEKVLRRYSALLARIPLPDPSPHMLSPPRPEREVVRERTQDATTERYQAIQALAKQGMSQCAIGRALGIHRHTVRKYLLVEGVPERLRKPRPSILTPHLGYLLERWRQGERNALELWREIVALGYPGTSRNVSRLVTQLRRLEAAGDELPTARASLTPRRAVSLVCMRPGERTTEQQATLKTMCGLHSDIEKIVPLVERFTRMIRARLRDELAGWLVDADASGIAEMQRFVTKLKQDLEAVQEALTSEWSQGQVEGQVTRLKLIRRQMYGRGEFDLVRKRVLRAA